MQKGLLTLSLHNLWWRMKNKRYAEVLKNLFLRNLYALVFYFLFRNNSQTKLSFPHEICVSQVGEHMSLGIRVSQVKEHISLGICASQVGEQISLGIRVS